MISLVRQPGQEYRVTTGAVPLEHVGFVERLFPQEWIAADSAGVEPAFVEYARPLLGDMPYYPRLE